MATNVAIVFTGKDQGASSLFRQLNREFDELARSGQRVNRALAAIGAGLSIGGLVAYTQSITGTLAALDDLAETTGESVENLSTLAAEARISGTQLDVVANFANRLARGLSAADDETKGVAKALAALGVDARNANGELKNTPELMREIAQALQRFADGPGKQAILSVLGGRGGAQLLPFLNDLARTSELSARATAAQAAAAEQAERAWRKLRLELDQAAQGLIVAALPAVEGLARGLDNVVRTSGRLSTESGVAQWAESAAIGVAIVADSLGGLVRLLGSVASSFQVVFADVKALGAGIAASLNPLNAEVQANYQRALQERETVLRTANARWDALWNYNGRAVEESVRRSIEAIKRGNQALADLAANADARDLRLMRRQQLDFAIGDSSGADKRIRDGEQLIEQLRRESAAIRSITAEERVLEELRDGKYRLTQQEKELVGVLLEQNVALRQQRAEVEMLSRRDLERLKRQQSAELEAEEEFARLRQQILQFTGQADEERRRRQTEVLEAMIAMGQVNEQQALRAVKAIAGIADEAARAKSVAEELGLTFASAFEDAIVKGGSLRDLLRGLEQDILRIITRTLVTEPLAEWLRGMFKGGGGGLGEIVSAIGRAIGLPSFDAGTPYVPRDMVAVVHRGERIVPARENRAGAMPGRVYNISVQAPAEFSRRSASMFGAEVARQIAVADARHN